MIGETRPLHEHKALAVKNKNAGLVARHGAAQNAHALLEAFVKVQVGPKNPQDVVKRDELIGRACELLQAVPVPRCCVAFLVHPMLVDTSSGGTRGKVLAERFGPFGIENSFPKRREFPGQPVQ